MIEPGSMKRHFGCCANWRCSSGRGAVLLAMTSRVEMPADDLLAGERLRVVALNLRKLNA